MLTTSTYYPTMLTLSTSLCQNSTVAAKSKKVYHHGNLRETLIATGLKLIAEKGVRALTLREIGSLAGVSRTAAYRHFKDKSDLLAAISEAGFAQFADALDQAAGSSTDAFGRLDAMAFAYVQFATDHPAYIEVMFGPSSIGPAGSSGERAFQILVQTIREGQQANEIRGGDPVLFAQVVWAQVHGISTLHFGTAFVPFSSEAIRLGIAVSRDAEKCNGHG
jgi:AcrR family transcriptional regulator